ncbi:MAG: SlyX family protein [Cephaloticoccus sp.]|jgi:SlyX protein
MAEALQRLEEKIAYLERHVGEQDKAMLEMAMQLDRLRQELVTVRDRMAEPKTDTSPVSEKPPHY